MKKLLIAFLALSLLLCACASEEKANPEEISELSSAIEKTNSENRFSGQYLIEIGFGAGVTLYYAMGDIACDRSEKQASLSFSQTYLGVSAKVENYIKNGVAVTVEDGDAEKTELDTDVLLSKFPYSRIFGYDDTCKSLKSAQSSLGKTFTAVRSNTKQICDSVIGDDIYSLAEVIKQPQRDKTEYSETTCIYTVKDGRVVGCRYEFTVKLYDTPAYVPGYSVPENEYTLELKVSAKISYDSFGADAEIAEYSEIE